MKYKSVALGILFVFAFCTAQITLAYFFPDRATNFKTWSRFYIAKDAVYDAMFFLSSLLVFWNSSKVLKAIMFFSMVVTGGSLFDKWIMGLNQYLWSDVVLLGVGLGVSIYLYITEWKQKTILGSLKS